jgi:hypothetical protein
MVKDDCWIGCTTVTTTSAEEGGSGSDSDDDKESGYQKFVDKFSYTEILLVGGISGFPIMLEVLTDDFVKLPAPVLLISGLAFSADIVVTLSKLYFDIFGSGTGKAVLCASLLGFLCDLDKIFGWL